MTSIPPNGPRHTPPQSDIGSTKQADLRFGFNATTQEFEPMKKGDPAKREHLAQVQEDVSQLDIPTDRSSPTLLKKIAPPNYCTGTKLQSNTKGVKDFFSGNAALFNSFISSVRSAQRSLS